MRQPADYLPGDLRALRYLDALDAGDLETFAALWEEASHDRQLERMLAEIDNALFVEDAGSRPVRLVEPSTCKGVRKEWGLSPCFRGKVPILSERPKQQRWRIWVGVAGAVAAACLAAALLWPRSQDPTVDRHAPKDGPVVRGPHGLPTDTTVSAWEEGRRILAGARIAAFHWPLEEKSPPRARTSIPPDQLD
jgi:hypothetical protein